MSCQHNAVFLLRVRSPLSHRHGTMQNDIIICRMSLHGKHMIPPGIYLRNFREETVSSHIHTVSFIIDRLGDTTETVTFFKYNHLNILGFCKQFISCSKTCRTCTNNQGFLHSGLTAFLSKSYYIITHYSASWYHFLLQSAYQSETEPQILTAGHILYNITD